MILDIWEDKTLDYITVINAISTFWKIYILSFNIFLMKKWSNQALILLWSHVWLKALLKQIFWFSPNTENYFNIFVSD